MMDKNELRKIMKEKRKALSSDQRRFFSEIICEKVIKTEMFKKAENVCVYMSAFGEVLTEKIIDECRNCGKALIFPVSEIKSHTINLCLDCVSFTKGAYGISEPEIKEAVPYTVPDLIIIPALAFDENRNRLGFGAGYYDRFLSKSRGFKMGICYDFQIVDEIETKPHDVKADMVITEKREFWGKKSVFLANPLDKQ